MVTLRLYSIRTARSSGVAGAESPGVGGGGTCNARTDEQRKSPLGQRERLKLNVTEPHMFLGWWGGDCTVQAFQKSLVRTT